MATGISSELLRLSHAASAMYAVYFVHLVLIFALFLYAPYSKFAHLLYRTVAIASVIGEQKRLEAVEAAGPEEKQPYVCVACGISSPTDDEDDRNCDCKLD